MQDATRIWLTETFHGAKGRGIGVAQREVDVCCILINLISVLIYALQLTEGMISFEKKEFQATISN